MLPLIADCHNDIALDEACGTEAHMQHPRNQSEERSVLLSPRSGSRDCITPLMTCSVVLWHLIQDRMCMPITGGPVRKATSVVVCEAEHPVPGEPP